MVFLTACVMFSFCLVYVTTRIVYVLRTREETLLTGV